MHARVAAVRWTEAPASASIPGELLPVLLEELGGTSLVTLVSINPYSQTSEMRKVVLVALHTGHRKGASCKTDRV